jgi:immune inhibitor A
MKRILSIAITMILLSSIFLIAAPTKGANTIADVEPVDWQSGLAGNVPMPKLDPTDAGEAARAAAIMSSVVPPTVGTRVWDWYLRALGRSIYGPTTNHAYMTLRAISGNVEVWVAGNPAMGDYRLLKFLDGDPRNADPRDWNVTDAMCQFIADEFNNVIYPTCTNYFGIPAGRDGTDNYFQYVYAPYPERYTWIPTDNPQRVIIKIFNILDSAFYNASYPSYVVGFFSPTYDSTDYYDRNMIQMDNWNYSQRLGPMGYSWYTGRTVTRPYVYESTVAHEFQHLIHADYNPGDESFMNEGCSMYSELLCNYGIDPNYLNYYFYTPDNSLTMWGDLGDIDILADYGESALWAVYLSDHYGGAPFIRSFVQNGIPGIDGVNNALAEYGYNQRFDDVFHDWRLANLIRAADGPYSYKSLDLNAPGIIPVRMYPVNGFPVPWTTGTSFGDTITIRNYTTGVSKVGPYGTDYVAFTNWDRPGFIGFDGDNIAIVPGWEMTSDGWYSGTGIDLQNALIAGSVTVPVASPTLTLETKYGIESYWDFGFVQVSTDGGNTWTSLANDYTTTDHDPGAHPAIVANLPGLTDYNPDWPNWTTMSFDLTAYAGQTVMIGFRYMTDWASTYEGWWIKNPTIGGTALTLAPVYPKASYQVTAVKALSCGKSGKFNYIPYDLKLDPNNWTGEHNTFAKNPTYIVLVVSPTMPMGIVDYQFRAYKK